MKKTKSILAGTMIAGAVALQGTASKAQTAASNSAASAETIRPFQIHVPRADLDELRRRVLATKWPSPVTVKDETQGVQFAPMQKLASYWTKDYDWRKIETKLNALPQFMTTIDGVDIHFIHVRSKHKNALPVIITHGWPGSIIEQLKIIGPLTDPTSYEGKAEDAFDVVIPSLPGHGFSGKRRLLFVNRTAK
jgi:Epoxide hydrolase N terminus